MFLQQNFDIFKTLFQTMAADSELTAILNRRQKLLEIITITKEYYKLLTEIFYRNEINEAIDSGQDVKPRFVKCSVYVEFAEFSRKQIKDYEKIFQT